MNTRIGCIAHWQSRLGDFSPSPSPKPAKDLLDGGDDDDDASSSEYDDEMTASQWFTLCHSWKKRGSSFVYESSHGVRGRACIGIDLLGGEFIEWCSEVLLDIFSLHVPWSWQSTKLSYN